jgi:uncharacterized protein (DUF1501 family)
MMATRRLFLKSSGLAMFGFGTSPLWLQRAVAAPDPMQKKVLVAIFQRGAVDGLNVVVPFGEANYSRLRPNIAVSTPSRGDNGSSAIDLDGFFGLHPSLAPLKPIYDAKQLAIIHAVGSPDPTRSHFDAQDYMESGTPGRKTTADGWLNRALTQEKDSSPVRAISVGTTLARTLRGSNDAVAVQSVDKFRVSDSDMAGAFETMYASALDGVLQGAGRETFEAVKLMESIRQRPYTPANGAEYPSNPLGQSLLQIARMIKANAGLEVAFADMGGWDTHANEPAQLQNLLTQFGSALAAFHRDMGDRMEDVAVVTMSEFGRTAKENGARGTDHGHANVMFAFGADIRGGKVYGDWPGLEQEQLFEGRDLAVTTDFRDVLGELVSRHLGGAPVSKVFPGYTTPKYRGLVAV